MVKELSHIFCPSAFDHTFGHYQGFWDGHDRGSSSHEVPVKEIMTPTKSTRTLYSPLCASVKKWAVEFKRDRDGTKDDPWSARLKTSTTDEEVDAIHGIILDDRRLTVQ